jgi:hypothetical protein
MSPAAAVPDVGRIGPFMLTILPTYQCTAACAECCFESSPHVTGRISLDRIRWYLDEAVRAFPQLRLVCFSGGECFLLRDDLDRAIAAAHAHGLRTRSVTNGYWAVNERAALARLEPLRAAGLDELNISTGDEHQRYVPFARVAQAAVTAATLGIRTVIVIEGHQQAGFTLADARRDARIRDFALTPAAGHLKMITNVWMPFHEGAGITHDAARLPESRGCENLLVNAVVTPHEQLAACCGLTMEHIPELKLGDLRDAPIGSLYDRQYNDLLKLWIWLDGPHAIYQFARAKDPALPPDPLGHHQCFACAVVHQNAGVRALLDRHYPEIAEDVLSRYYLRRLAVTANASAATAAEVSIQFGA